MEKFDKTRLTIQGRSDGDGMEYTNYTENAFNKDQNSIKFNSSELSYSKNFLPLLSKKKEPKFVPYEPYKAAVSPIIPNPKKCENLSTHLVIDSQKVSSLASSIIKFNSRKELKSYDKDNSDTFKTDGACETTCGEKCTDKFRKMEEKIAQLEKEKKEMESQFQIQIDVNADLKKMLLASLGEDMHLKVQLMTEDKARLGMNVLQFSEEIKLKNEEIEKLSVQCDVLKSKFEASSVMVDELARWKVTLSQKLGQAANAFDSVLKEHKVIFDQLSSTCNILQSTQMAFSPTCQRDSKWENNPKSLIQLAKDIQTLCLSLQERLLGRSCPRTNALSANKIFSQFTPAEHSALQVLEDFDNLPFLVNSNLPRQWLHHGPGKTACQILPHVCSHDTTINCCKHCTGEIKLL